MIKALIISACAVILFGQASMCEASSTPQSFQSSSLSAPSRKCDIRLPVWCILQGASRVTLVNKVESGYNDFWLLRGPFGSGSKLVILEPIGCRSGISNTFNELGFDSGVHWHQQTWDRIIVKLKRDGSCNIAILFPPFDNDQMEWAFSSGLMLIRACQDKMCSNDGPDAGELRSLYRNEFERKKVLDSPSNRSNNGSEYRIPNTE